MENLAAGDRTPSEDLIALYVKLAQGRLGLIITSSVRPDRSWDPHAKGRGMCFDKETMIPAYKKMVSRVHAAGSKIVIQLGTFFRYNNKSAAPCEASKPNNGYVVTTEDIRDITKQYGLAGEYSRTAGFDGIQINAAHGFPLSRFLSPCYNLRQDDYGGSVVNRTRIISEIADEIKQRCGSDFPVLIKMNVDDFCDGGIDMHEAQRIARIIAASGIAAIEASGGGIGHDMTWLGPVRKKEWQEGYLRPHAAGLKAETSLPIIMVGGLRNYAMVEEVLQRQEADLVAMSRPLIREPGLIRRWEEGDRRPATCISCNGCMQRFKENRIVRCVAEKT
jgi:2,4-dienoyl-CoA reductase-like NADH-dependent reductase (Old Yellow Enzyme family)